MYDATDDVGELFSGNPSPGSHPILRVMRHFSPIRSAFRLMLVRSVFDVLKLSDHSANPELISNSYGQTGIARDKLWPNRDCTK